ncbi:uncharacterized protein MICPUCDRAFT_4179, partial [Micromonas pusilla CCMP1545]
PSIAFLFLTRGALPHDHLWGKFFARQDRSAYAIHVHAPPGFVFDETTTRVPWLFNARVLLPNPVAAWGDAALVRAEKKLLRRALEASPSAMRFVLLSESCVPLRSFAFVRAYLYVEASLDHNDRYPGVAMAKDGVPRRAWRKGSQWFAMTREHATIVAEDVEVFEAFEKHCNVTARRAAGGGGGGGGDDDAATSAHTGANGWSTFCAPDEHYIPTLFALRGIERELEGRGVTYTNW